MQKQFSTKQSEHGVVTQADTSAQMQSVPDTQRQQLRRQQLRRLQQCYGNRYMQRVADTTKADNSVAPDVETAIRNHKRHGRPLDSRVRTQMEPAFGTNFNSVQVHTDATAHNLNVALQARAFTTGQDIFFRRGAYSPGTSAGRELIAHELTHVVQQTGRVQRKMTLGQPGDRYEQEADQMARAVIQRESLPVPIRRQTAQIQEEDESVQQQAEEDEPVQTQTNDEETNQRQASQEDRGDDITLAQTEEDDQPVQRQAEQDDESAQRKKNDNEDEQAAVQMQHVAAPHFVQAKSVATTYPTPVATTGHIQRGFWDRVGSGLRRVGGAIAGGVRSVGGAIASVGQRIGGAIMGQVRSLARDIPGYHLLTVVLGRDVITDDPVARNATNLIRGFLSTL